MNDLQRRFERAGRVVAPPSMSSLLDPQNASYELLVEPEEWTQGSVGQTVAIDFETFYTAAYSVAELGLWAYCHDPRFEAYLVAVTDGQRTCVCAPSKFPWATISGRTWVSHHRDFDRAVFKRLQELGAVPTAVTPSAWFCLSLIHI